MRREGLLAGRDARGSFLAARPRPMTLLSRRWVVVTWGLRERREWIVDAPQKRLDDHDPWTQMIVMSLYLSLQSLCELHRCFYDEHRGRRESLLSSTDWQCCRFVMTSGA